MGVQEQKGDIRRTATPSAGSNPLDFAIVVKKYINDDRTYRLT